MSIKVTSDMPINLGLGGSAGYSIVIAAGLHLGFQLAFEVVKELDFERPEVSVIHSYAQYLEQLIHEVRHKEYFGLDVALEI